MGRVKQVLMEEEEALQRPQGVMGHNGETGFTMNTGAEIQTPVRNPLEANRCCIENCTMVLTPRQMATSLEVFNSAVCLLHQKAIYGRTAMQILKHAVQEVILVHPEHKTEAARVIECSNRNCTELLTGPEATLSMQRYGSPLCQEHQKQAMAAQVVQDAVAQETVIILSDGGITAGDVEAENVNMPAMEKPGKPLVLYPYVMMRLWHVKKAINAIQNPPGTPPETAKFLLATFLSRDRQEDEVGDLCEMFERRLEEYGPRRARFWFCVQTFRCLCPHLGETIMALLRRILLEYAEDWIRRIGS